MIKNAWKDVWKQEEQHPFQGWDFSHIERRMKEEPLPWDYRAIVQLQMTSQQTMLDMGTGGGEFLLSLNPTAGKTFATESYLPNIALSRERLQPYGIMVRAVKNDSCLPFEDQSFDLIINRHESFCLNEVYRILKPGGYFITQQVGGCNNRELAKFLLGSYSTDINDNFNLKHVCNNAKHVGFRLIEQAEYYPKATFSDIGALVYFAKIIEWEFPGFSVDRCFNQLMSLQQLLEKQGYIETLEHRFLLVAQKPVGMDYLN